MRQRRDNSVPALEKYTELKSTWLASQLL